MGREMARHELWAPPWVLIGLLSLFCGLWVFSTASFHCRIIFQPSLAVQCMFWSSSSTSSSTCDFECVPTITTLNRLLVLSVLEYVSVV